jgi:hypothetical protein
VKLTSSHLKENKISAGWLQSANWFGLDTDVSALFLPALDGFTFSTLLALCLGAYLFGVMCASVSVLLPLFPHPSKMCVLCTQFIYLLSSFAQHHGRRLTMRMCCCARCVFYMHS